MYLFSHSFTQIHMMTLLTFHQWSQMDEQSGDDWGVGGIIEDAIICFLSDTVLNRRWTSECANMGSVPEVSYHIKSIASTEVCARENGIRWIGSAVMSSASSSQQLMLIVGRRGNNCNF